MGAYLFLMVLPTLAPAIVGARKGVRWGLVVVGVQLAILLLGIVGMPPLNNPYTATAWLITTFLVAAILGLQAVVVRVTGCGSDKLRGTK